jgi:hypothetical protein
VINPLVTVTCILVELNTWVFMVVLLIITTVEDTKLLPVRVRTNPVWTSARVTVLGEIEVKTGLGRDEEQNGFSAEQPQMNSSKPQIRGRTRDRMRRLSKRDSSLCSRVFHRTGKTSSGGYRWGELLSAALPLKSPQLNVAGWITTAPYSPRVSR